MSGDYRRTTSSGSRLCGTSSRRVGSNLHYDERPLTLSTKNFQPTNTNSKTSQAQVKSSNIEISIETNQQPSDHMRLARHHGIERSLFERSILNDVYSRQLGYVHSTNHVYPPLGDTSEELPSVRGVVDNLYVLKHEQYIMNEDDSWSRTAQMTLLLAQYLIQQDYKPDDLIILTAYDEQMIYMENERALYANVTKVKMSVVEDYGGEEYKIVLLSLPLLKNSFTEEIRFLAMEMKLIMAISKAKEGFYVFGDMEVLKRKSPLWSNIETILMKKGFIGQGLRLKCANHVFQITTIENVTDFTKVPEGGCLRDCKYKLSCGHMCPRICHAYDIAHSNIKCDRPCERKICEIRDDKCTLPCSSACKPCQRPMMKGLPCGHRKEVPCHYEAGDPRIYCEFIVTVTLLDCGHEVSKACSMKISEVKCTKKCMNSRLDCGHSCLRTCHVNDDPNHENYKCEKPCSKPKRGCTANAESDLPDHQCPKRCYEECPDCNVQVIKLSLRSSSCRHPRRVACHVKVDQVPCLEKCDLFLPCGHPCTKLCCEPCGDCQFMVKKKVPECHHEIEIACSVNPTRAKCTSKCDRTLDCGHECPGRCNQSCEAITCNKIMERNFDSPCGHKVKLPCHALNNILTDGLKPALLVRYCSAPCGTVLRCGHACGGSCAACLQGRMHAPCAVACDRVNVCGHRCKEPCHEKCPPCTERCQLKCQHSACNELCGAPCTPCTEPECCRACEHSQCSLACGAACDTPPCARACRKLQACGHRCRGVCGEPCPAACNICDPEHFPADLTGHPYDDDDKLIQMQDCRHILDVETLDRYMNSELENIQMKGCPFCRKPVVNTYRYKDIINRLIKNDINPIKERIYGTLIQRQAERKMLLEKVQRLNLKVDHKLALAHTNWKPAFNLIEKAIEDKTTSLNDLKMYHNNLDLLQKVGEHYMKYREGKLKTLKAEKEELVNLICDILVNNQKMSKQQLEDTGKEIRRLNCLIQLAAILEKPSYQRNKNETTVLEASVNATEAVMNWRVFDDTAAVLNCIEKLQDAVILSDIDSKKERERVPKGYWYKDRNGHFYCVDEKGRTSNREK